MSLLLPVTETSKHATLTGGNHRSLWKETVDLKNWKGRIKGKLAVQQSTLQHFITR